MHYFPIVRLQCHSLVSIISLVLFVLSKMNLGKVSGPIVCFIFSGHMELQYGSYLLMEVHHIQLLVTSVYYRNVFKLDTDSRNLRDYLNKCKF